MTFKILSITIFFLIPFSVSAEIINLSDGRSVDLRSDGTYSFVEIKKQITVSASGCKNSFSTETDKDDFNNIVGYKYFPGFSLQYKISNDTDFSLVVRKLAHEFSRDYGTFYTLLKTPTFADPIEPGRNLMLSRDSHLFYVNSKVELDDDQVEALKIKYGCSNENLAGQKIIIDTGLTKMKFPPNAGNLDPMDLLNAVSEIEGLSLEVR